MTKQAWLITLAAVLVIGVGSAIYYKNKIATDSATQTEATPSDDTTTDAENKSPNTGSDGAAVNAGVSASEDTIGELTDDISDIEEDTGSGNNDDEKPNY